MRVGDLVRYERPEVFVGRPLAGIQGARKRRAAARGAPTEILPAGQKLQRGDAETQRRRDAETQRRGDAETREKLTKETVRLETRGKAKSWGHCF